MPSLFFSGLILLGLGMMQNTLVDKIAGGKTGAIFVLVTAWFILISLCATMNIATDGWALGLLSKPNVHWATTAHAFGLSSGYFISFNLFLLLSSSSKQVHRAPVLAQLEEVLSPAKFLCSWGLVFTFGAILLAAVKGEHQSSSSSKKAGLCQAYGVIWRIVRKPNVQVLMLVHLICTIGFQTNDSITILQLVKHRFTNSEVAGLATVSFPCELLYSAFLSMTFRHYHPLKVWQGLFPLKLFTAAIAQCCVFFIQSLQQNSLALVSGTYRTPAEQVHGGSHVRSAVFFSQPGGGCKVWSHLQDGIRNVSDAFYNSSHLACLGTYLCHTLISRSTTNLGCAIPRFIHLKMVAALDGDDQRHSWETSAIDGYQIVNASGVALAVPVFWFWLRPTTVRLQRAALNSWKVHEHEGDST
jgi:MFS transporter, PAT family, solute carrier family 33 (acetyl-CoA transportor), member 1